MTSPHKNQLLRDIHEARAALEQRVAALSDDDLTRPGPEQWAVKDHLAHLSAWRRKVLALLAGRPAHEGLGIDKASYDAGNEDSLNAILYQRNRTRALPDILDEFHDVHRQIVAAVEPLTDAGLARPYYPDDPDDGRTLADGIAANTSDHDREHLPWIEELLASLPPAPQT